MPTSALGCQALLPGLGTLCTDCRWSRCPPCPGTCPSEPQWATSVWGWRCTRCG
ncbi:hypothetical protein PF007_g14783 [Phytophthora fragariae]|uniref:Uncharacterized protein n=1 Tax=Phytophthora fragariae TaxID=53985 RepID=A0A6A3RS49_9STRA|nr:hypothetical protein PF007_g14783 [Phytophthora fragariae]